MDSLSLKFVGSVKLGEHPELAAVPHTDPRFVVSASPGLKGTKAFRVTKTVAGSERILVITYNPKLAKAQGSYHGIADVLVVGDSSISFDAAGVPAGVTPGVAQDVVEFPFNDPDETESVLEREGADLAAVLVEPIMGAAGMVPAARWNAARLAAPLALNEPVCCKYSWAKVSGKSPAAPASAALTTTGRTRALIRSAARRTSSRLIVTASR